MTITPALKRFKAFSFSRRHLLTTAAAGVVTAGAPALAHARKVQGLPNAASPVPLSDVRLLPSHYLDAVKANTKYLMSLSPDRLLHNYHKFAGLPVKGEIYGGWESDTIAGEALGHYLTALSLLHAQTGHAEAKVRIDYIIDELIKVQAAHGDGYVAGFMRKRKDGSIVDGKEIFPEIMAGDIRSAGFDLNGCWVPFYNWHKLYNGLMDAQTWAGNDKGISVLIGLSGYIEKVFNALDDAQVQKVLDCEYGGINESFAELYSRTGDKRWLALAERIYHNRMLDPLVAGEDKLANNHANTQVPKLIGLARLYELTGKEDYRKASSFFWQRVVNHHSFVIGGNADREYFFQPDNVSKHITEQTCESCNTYNMLKLTRHLFSWTPQSSWFDYYERAHLNHIMAHQNPKTGMFAYMVPLMSGTARGWSTPENSFWCCVLSGIESHSKHGDSIYWHNEDTLFVNLFIPSKLNWAAQKASFELLTQYPYESKVAFKVTTVSAKRDFAVAVRIPGWASSHELLVNGKPALAVMDKGYAIIRRKWKAGDVVTLDMPLKLWMEPTPGNDQMVAVLRGPLVLAADLASAEDEWTGTAPALVGSDLIGAFKPVAAHEAVYRTEGIGRPEDMTFRPFYSAYERRTAVYFNRYTDAQWATAQVTYAEEQERLKELSARSVDVMYLGEMQPERDHNLVTFGNSYPVVYRNRNGRDARTGGWFTFEMNVLKDGKDAGPLLLQATYWGSEFNRSFTIEVDGTVIAHERLSGRQPGDWIEVNYPIPHELTKGKSKVTIKFNAQEGKTAGPVFGVRLFMTAPSGGAAA